MSNLKLWRESASVILLARTAFSSNKYNYKILCLKRSVESGFMPASYVFPGGVLSKSDSSLEWLKLYEKFGFSTNCFDDLMPKLNVPEIFLKYETDHLPRHLSLRICAIREMFEECGILLCRSIHVDYDPTSKWASFIGGPDFLQWQHRVHDNSKEFLNLCRELEVYPDIWALRNWCNWRTPAHLPKTFNTMFFIATLDQMPGVQVDKREVQDLMWTTPEDCLEKNRKKEIDLPIPQTYEMSRFISIHDIDYIADYADERSSFGCETYWPYGINTDDGFYAIFPGDDLYPENMESKAREIPYMEKIPDSNVQNRIRMWEGVSTVITKNYMPKCNHIMPSKL